MGMGPGLLIVLALLLIPTLLVYLCRRSNQKEQREIEQEQADYERWLAAYAIENAEWQKSVDEWTAEKDRTKLLSWPELRALCETKHGQPCECSTKEQVARAILGDPRRPRPVRPTPPPMRGTAF